jgi:UPF0755 protein
MHSLAIHSRSSQKSVSLKRIVLVLSLVLLALLGWIGYRQYGFYLEPNVPESEDERFVHIPTGSEFEDVVRILLEEGHILDAASFRQVAKRLDYIRSPMRSGRFQLQPGWSNLDLVRHLRNGVQATVKLVLVNEREPINVAAKAARFIEPDSLELLRVLQDKQLIRSLGYTPQNLMSIFIPNTYDFYWNISPTGFLERMHKEHERFWDKDERRKKAAALNLSPAEVYTLASIVEKETNQNAEKKRMAGVYVNRLKINMRLQADPTCVFATRDFETTRVLEYHLKFDSPYNTYLYAGLPPGPIAMASIASIDAVLNYESHDYYYFCAVGDGSGFHNFAKTLQGHNQNVAVYRDNLRKYRANQ